MLTNLEITLAVLVAVFGATTLAFIIYFIVKRCCPADIFSSRKNESNPVFSTLPSRGVENHVALDEIVSERPVFSGQVSRRIHKTANPEYTCRYRRQTLDVFSCTFTEEGFQQGQYPPSDANHLAINIAAQHCFESLETKSGHRTADKLADGFTTGRAEQDFDVLEVPRIEEVQIIPSQKARQSLIGPSTSSDIRPRSYVDLKATEGFVEQRSEVDVEHSMFICQTVGQEGGTVELYGIVLSIPAGALSKEEKISLGVVWTADHQPPLSSGEASLSPIVSCEPHGLRLAKAATLTVPHCAADISSDWSVKVLCSDTAMSSKPHWTTLANEQVQVLPHKINLTLNHFTLYTVTGESATVSARKYVDLVAFAPPLTGAQFQVRIYCINDYTDDDARDTKKMNKSEAKQKGKEVSSPASLVVYNDGNNLRINLDKISDSWSLSDVGPNPQEMDFEQVWHSLGPSCTFVLVSESQTDKVQCCFKGYQIEHDENKQTLIVAEERSVLKDSRIDPRKMHSVFPDELCDTIMKMLDPTLVSINNWESLAEVMDMNWKDTVWLQYDYKQSGRSPTIYLLNLWAERGKTLDEFQSQMRTLERLDIVDEIEKWRQKNNKRS